MPQTLIDTFKAGETDSTGRIGLEAEHFILDRKTGMPMPYGLVLSLLEHLDYPEKGYENGKLIQLENDTTLITLEPGCQVELSFACTDDLYAIMDWYAQGVVPIIDFADAHGYDVVLSGGLPTLDPEATPLIDKERYHLMDAWFKDHGTRGHEMMRGTTSNHLSIDYKDEADFVKKYRMANILHPVFAFLTANTPEYAGKPNEDILLRDSIWEGTDSARVGIVPGLFDEDFGYETYAKWLLSMPLITMNTKDGYIPYPGTVAQAGEEFGWTKDTVNHFLSMAFPDVRLKKFIEIRSADIMPLPWMMAYAALVKGLFYNPEAVKELSVLTDTETDIANAKKALRESGYDAVVYGMPVQDLARHLVDLAKAGLPEKEKRLLLPLVDLIEEKKHVYETEDGRNMEILY